MQSSAAVAARALIMLACVVGIPAFALSGTPWSEIVKKLQEFRWPAIVDPASASTSNAAGVSGPAGATPAAPFCAICQPPAMAASIATQPAVSAQSAVVPAGYQEPAVTALPVANATDEKAAAPPSDPFHSVQYRLRQLGATYYLLESWGSEPEMYRFYCKMAVGGSADYTRCFEATHAGPLQAMREVLRQVETWRGESNEERGSRK